MSRTDRPQTVPSTDRRPGSAASPHRRRVGAWGVLLPLAFVLLVLGSGGHVPAGAESAVLLTAVAAFTLALAALAQERAPREGAGAGSVVRVD